MTHVTGTSIAPRRTTVRRESLAIWARILHDPNPIHLDAEYVRSNDLGEAEINQGPANLAYVINALTDAFPGGRIEKLDIRFVGNAFVGETLEAKGTIAELHSSGSDEVIVLDVSLSAGERVVLGGSAVVRRPL